MHTLTVRLSQQIYVRLIKLLLQDAALFMEFFTGAGLSPQQVIEVVTGRPASTIAPRELAAKEPVIESDPVTLVDALELAVTAVDYLLTFEPPLTHLPDSPTFYTAADVVIDYRQQVKDTPEEKVLGHIAANLMRVGRLRMGSGRGQRKAGGQFRANLELCRRTLSVLLERFKPCEDLSEFEAVVTAAVRRGD